MSASQRFPVTAAKNAELQRRMAALGLEEKDFVETYFKTLQSGGKSGLLGVSIRHSFTGIHVRCQRERSQGINRFLARRMLVEKLEALHCSEQQKTTLSASLPPQNLPLPIPPAHWGLRD